MVSVIWGQFLTGKMIIRRFCKVHIGLVSSLARSELPLKGHFRESCFNFKVMHVENFSELRKIEKIEKRHLGQITLRFM